MNYAGLYVFVVVVLDSATLSKGKLPGENKICCLRGKTRHKFVCKGRMIVLSTEMARVAESERGNFVCELHYNQLRERNNICSCPLTSHSTTMSNIPIPARLYIVFDQAGRKMPSYRPGTRWCTSCKQNADKKLSTMAEYQKPAKRKTVGTATILFSRNITFFFVVLCKNKIKISEKYFQYFNLAWRKREIKNIFLIKIKKIDFFFYKSYHYNYGSFFLL